MSYICVDKLVMELQSIGLAGLEKAQEKLQQSAKRLASLGANSYSSYASSSTDTVDLSAEVVALSQAKLLAEANRKVVESANELSSRVLDILA